MQNDYYVETTSGATDTFTRKAEAVKFAEAKGGGKIYTNYTESDLNPDFEQVESAPTETIHVTGVRDGGVYGHPTSRCDEAGCAAGTELFYAKIDSRCVTEQHVYEFVEESGVVAYEIED